MEEILKFLIGILVLGLGFPIGNYLKKLTLDEQKTGQKWFRLVVFLSLLGGVIGLVLGKDSLIFSFFFMAIVTSRSLKNR